MAEELFCICRKPYVEEELMIACDKCEEWYHPKCAGLKDSDLDFVASYFCKKCSNDKVHKMVFNKGAKVPERLKRFGIMSIADLNKEKPPKKEKMKPQVDRKRKRNTASVASISGEDLTGSSLKKTKTLLPVETTPDKAIGDIRVKARKNLADMLRFDIEPEFDASKVDDIAAEVEGLIYDTLNPKEYKQKYRTLLMNIKRNATLRRRILLNDVLPNALVAMKNEELASEDVKKEVMEARQKNLESAIKRDANGKVSTEHGGGAPPATSSPAGADKVEVHEKPEMVSMEELLKKSKSDGSSPGVIESYKSYKEGDSVPIAEKPFWRGSISQGKRQVCIASAYHVSGKPLDIKVFPHELKEAGTLLQEVLEGFLNDIQKNSTSREITLLRLEATSLEAKNALSEYATMLISKSKASVLLQTQSLEIYMIPPESQITHHLWAKLYNHCTLCCVFRKPSAFPLPKAKTRSPQKADKKEFDNISQIYKNELAATNVLEFIGNILGDK